MAQGWLTVHPQDTVVGEFIGPGDHSNDEHWGDSSTGAVDYGVAVTHDLTIVRFPAYAELLSTAACDRCVRSTRRCTLSTVGLLALQGT